MWPTESTEGHSLCETHDSPAQEVFAFPFNRRGNTGTWNDIKPVPGCQLGLGGDGIKKPGALDSKFCPPGLSTLFLLTLSLLRVNKTLCVLVGGLNKVIKLNYLENKK